MSLRRRILLLVAMGLIAATVPLGVMGVGMLRAATDRILQERLTMARATAGHLSARLRLGWSQLDRLSAEVAAGWGAADPSAVRSITATLAPQITIFSSGVYVIDRKGRLVAASGQELPGLRGAVTGLPSVRATMQQGRPAVSRLVRASTGIPAVILSVPIAAPDGETLGAVAAALDLSGSTLQAFIDGLPVGRTGHAALVDEGGTILASTAPLELFTRDEHPEFLARLIGQGRPMVGVSDPDHKHAGQFQRHIIAFAPLEGVPWGLAIGEDEGETFGPIRGLRDRIILFDLFVLAAALVFAWMDTGAVVRPLQALKEAAEEIAGGDLRRQVEVRRADEVGALARSFEAMRRRLLGSLEEIRRRGAAAQALYEVGAEVLRLQDGDAVLHSIAVRTRELLGGEISVICLLEQPGTVRVGAVAGAASVEEGQVIHLPGGEAGGCPGCAGLDAQCSSRLIAPLTAAGRIIGSLCVASNSPRTFSDEDREVLGGLANLAALAVENARLQEQVQSAAVLEERERIAREMHDGAGQVLGYVNTKVQAVRTLLDAGRTAEAQLQLAQLETASRQVYADLREAILGLRVEAGPDRGLGHALEEYVARFSEMSGVVTRLVAEDGAGPAALGPITELQLIRIIQEALTNVRKHAQARHAWVTLSYSDEAVTVTVSDDGVGLDPERGGASGWPKFGLQTMRERAEAIGGVFAVRPRPGAGTEVVVRVPREVR